MFDQTFVNTRGQTRKPWTVAVSLTLQTAVIAIALIVPLLRIAPLELPPKIPILLPLEKVDLKVRPAMKSTPNRAPQPVFHLEALPLYAPIAVPRRIDVSSDAPEIGTTSATPGPTASPLGGLMPVIVAQPPPAQIVKPSPPAPSSPLPVGGDVQAGKLVFGPSPAYPRIAITTRTQGTVKIQAIIGRDGAIRNLQLVSGPPLLVAAAMEAVKQWRYKPTLLNREPVEVITVIDVNFTLSH